MTPNKLPHEEEISKFIDSIPSKQEFERDGYNGDIWFVAGSELYAGWYLNGCYYTVKYYREGHSLRARVDRDNVTHVKPRSIDR